MLAVDIANYLALQGILGFFVSNIISGANESWALVVGKSCCSGLNTALRCIFVKVYL